MDDVLQVNPRDLDQLLLWKLLDRGHRMQPNEKILTRTSGGGYHSITHREHYHAAQKLGAALLQWGLKPQDRVATLMWNNTRHLQAYHALPGIGAVVHTLNIRLSPKELGYIISHAADRVLLVDQDLLPALEAVDPGGLDTVELILICGHDMKPSTCRSSLQGAVDYDVFMATGNPGPGWEWAEVDEKQPMGLCYTSGTTGRPKGVDYSHRAMYLITMCITMKDYYQMSGSDTLLSIVPMFHAWAWVHPYTALMLGTRIVLPGLYTKPDDLAAMIVEHGVTFTGGVPTIWQSLRSVFEQNLAHYREHLKLDRIVIGGSAPPEDLMMWYKDNFGVDFYNAWGMTESVTGTCARRVARRQDLDLDVREQFKQNVAGTPGLPLPHLRMKIVDPENLSTELPQDGESVGELLIKGPVVTGRYYNNPQAAEKFHDGWLATGDVCKINPAGQLVLVDRSKDLIKSGGEWISSKDVENLIASLDPVEMACVVAVPHPKWDERPIAIVKLRSGLTITAQDVLSRCLEVLAKYEVPDDVLFLGGHPIHGHW